MRNATIDALVDLVQKRQGGSWSAESVPYATGVANAIANAANGNTVRVEVTGPGDLTISIGPHKIELKMPIGADAWYRFYKVNILPDDKSRADALVDYIDCDPIKPLSGPRRNTHTGKVIDSTQVPVIKEMLYENWSKAGGPVSSSPSPEYWGRTSSKPLGDVYACYIELPLGPLGVMESVAIWSTLCEGKSNGGMKFEPVGNVAKRGMLDNFLSPLLPQGKCAGLTVIDKAYNWKDLHDVALRKTPDDYVTYVRFYVKNSWQWPTPGEFVGGLARPLPYHVWWEQESSPFLYTGNWFETFFYTTGEVVREIVPNVDIAGRVRFYSIRNNEVVWGEELDNTKRDFYLYEVEVRGWRFTVFASDFRRYKEGEKVSFLKKLPIDNCDNFCQSMLIDGDKVAGGVPKDLPEGTYCVNITYVLIPVCFYDESQEDE